jgi:hypothetical protein
LRLVGIGCKTVCREILNLGRNNVFLHDLYVHFIVEVDDVFLLIGLTVDSDRDINALDVLLVLEHVCVLCNDVVKCYVRH